jgi:hypothetical protein
MILPTGNKKFFHFRRALTFIEIIAVVTLIAIGTGVAVHSFRSSSGPLRKLSQNLIRDIQGAYHQSLRQGEIFRLEFIPGENRYRLLRFEFPPPPPSPEDREAFRDWEEQEKERQDQLRQLSRSERVALTTLDRAQYVLVEDREFSDSVELIEIRREQKNALEPEASYILFYPTGEMDSVLLILRDGGGREMSLVTEPYSGRVKTFNRALTDEEWAQERLPRGAIQP